jgi:hypothetical protein
MNILFIAFCEELGLDIQAISNFLARGTRIGKILRKMGLHPNKVQRGVLLYRAEELASNVEITYDLHTIMEAYTSVESCMTEQAEEVAAFYSNPMLVNQGLRLAVYLIDNTVVGRTLINTHTHGRCEIYSKQSSLEFEIALEYLGYTYGPNVLSRLELPLEGFLPYFDEMGGCIHQWKIIGANWRKATPEITDLVELCKELSDRFNTPVQDMETWIGDRWVRFTELDKLYRLEYIHSCRFSSGVYTRHLRVYPQDERYCAVRRIVDEGFGLRGTFHEKVVEMLWRIAKESPWNVHYWTTDDYGELQPTFCLEKHNENGFGATTVKEF